MSQESWVSREKRKMPQESWVSREKKGKCHRNHREEIKRPFIFEKGKEGHFCSGAGTEASWPWKAEREGREKRTR